MNMYKKIILALCCSGFFIPQSHGLFKFLKFFKNTAKHATKEFAGEETKSLLRTVYKKKTEYSSYAFFSIIGITPLILMLDRKRRAYFCPRKMHELFERYGRKSIKLAHLLGANLKQKKLFLLHKACEKNDKKLVKYLIKNGVDINKQNTRLETPLICSLKHGHEDLALFLLLNSSSKCNTCFQLIN